MVDPDNVIDVSVEPRKIPPMQGMQWIVNAFYLYKQAPLAWLAICGVFVVLFLGMSIVPFFGTLISNLLGPVFLGGVMLAGQKQARGDVPQVSDLFAGFKLRFVELFKVGLLYFIGTVVVMIVMAALFAIAGSLGLLSGLELKAQSLEGLVGMLPLFAIVLLAFSVVYSTYFFAPTLVILQGMSAVEAMKLSFLAFWRNWQPILVMSLVVGIALSVLLAPFMLSAITVLIPSIAIPLSQAVLAFLVLCSAAICILMVPVMLLTSYVCYVDVFES